MTFKIEVAKREKLKLKLAVTAPSGGGKTYSSLLLAAGLAEGDWSKVGVLDTEQSAGLYADLGPYMVAPFKKPQSSVRYIEAIDFLIDAGMEVLILDSITPEWDWCLEYHSNLSGNSFVNWGKVKPFHNKFMAHIINAPVHIICTIRRKKEYGLENEGGKTKVEKLGMKQQQQEDAEYEFTTVWALNQNHLAKAEKDRTGLFMDRPEFVIDQSTGKELLNWTNGGALTKQHYTGTDMQKHRLLGLMTRNGVEDKTVMASISNDLLDKPFDETVICEVIAKHVPAPATNSLS
jgi:hypothetical protein